MKVYISSFTTLLLAALNMMFATASFAPRCLPAQEPSVMKAHDQATITIAFPLESTMPLNLKNDSGHDAGQFEKTIKDT